MLVSAKNIQSVSTAHRPCKKFHESCMHGSFSVALFAVMSSQFEYSVLVIVLNISVKNWMKSICIFDSLCSIEPC